MLAGEGSPKPLKPPNPHPPSHPEPTSEAELDLPLAMAWQLGEAPDSDAERHGASAGPAAPRSALRRPE